MQRLVVVGGGVLGMMHAAAARERGHHVVHLEREPGPRGASVRNFGLIWVSGRAPGPELELALRCRDLWERLADRVPGTGFRPHGSLTIGDTYAYDEPFAFDLDERPYGVPGDDGAAQVRRAARPESPTREPAVMRGVAMTARISVACLDMAGTTVADEGSVMSAFRAAMEQFGLVPGAPGYDRATEIVRVTMGQSKIEVFRRILGDESSAAAANSAFEERYARIVGAGEIAPLPGAEQTLGALRDAGIRSASPPASRPRPGTSCSTRSAGAP